MPIIKDLRFIMINALIAIVTPVDPNTILNIVLYHNDIAQFVDKYGITNYFKIFSERAHNNYGVNSFDFTLKSTIEALLYDQLYEIKEQEDSVRRSILQKLKLEIESGILTYNSNYSNIMTMILCPWVFHHTNINNCGISYTDIRIAILAELNKTLENNNIETIKYSILNQYPDKYFALRYNPMNLSLAYFPDITLKNLSFITHDDFVKHEYLIETLPGNILAESFTNYELRTLSKRFWLNITPVNFAALCIAKPSALEIASQHLSTKELFAKTYVEYNKIYFFPSATEVITNTEITPEDLLNITPKEVLPLPIDHTMIEKMAHQSLLNKIAQCPAKLIIDQYGLLYTYLYVYNRNLTLTFDKIKQINDPEILHKIKPDLLDYFGKILKDFLPEQKLLQIFSVEECISNNLLSIDSKIKYSCLSGKIKEANDFCKQAYGVSLLEHSTHCHHTHHNMIKEFGLLEIINNHQDYHAILRNVAENKDAYSAHVRPQKIEQFLSTKRDFQHHLHFLKTLAFSGNRISQKFMNELDALECSENIKGDIETITHLASLYHSDHLF
jgi:hypothetical protein